MGCVFHGVFGHLFSILLLTLMVFCYCVVENFLSIQKTCVNLQTDFCCKK